MGNHTPSSEPKKVHFGYPLIMGLSFWVIAFSVLSMCDGPKSACCAKSESECHAPTEGHHGNNEKPEVKAPVAGMADSTALTNNDSTVVGTETAKTDSLPKETTPTHH